MLTSKNPRNDPTPEYPRVFFSCGSLSVGGKYGIGSRAAKSANKLGGRNCVMLKIRVSLLFSHYSTGVLYLVLQLHVICYY